MSRRALIWTAIAVAGAALAPTTPIAAPAGGRSGTPDSVIATVGAQSITLADFRRTWRETHPGATSDSLTPESARRFLEVLIDHELIRQAAGREPRKWTAEDSAAYAAKFDRLTLSAALASALAAARAAAGDSADDEEALGVLAREQVMGALAPRFADEAIARLARAFAAITRPSSDSSLAVQLRMLSALPAIPAADSAAVLAHTTRGGDVRVNDVVQQWARLSPAYRPRVETKEQVRDLIANVLFERGLRSDAANHGYERDPAIARILERERELIAVQHLMEREVHGTIVMEPRAIERYWRAHEQEWTKPARWQVVRLVADDRAAAMRWALLLRDAAASESLVVRARRQGVSYRTEIPATDSATFARVAAAGPGVVLGPYETNGQWTVLRVEGLLPARTPPLEEVRRQVEDRWYAEASATRLAELLARERRRHRIRIRNEALEHAALGWPDELTEP